MPVRACVLKQRQDEDAKASPELPRRLHQIAQCHCRKHVGVRLKRLPTTTKMNDNYTPQETKTELTELNMQVLAYEHMPGESRLLRPEPSHREQLDRQMPLARNLTQRCIVPYDAQRFCHDKGLAGPASQIRRGGWLSARCSTPAARDLQRLYNAFATQGEQVAARNICAAA